MEKLKILFVSHNNITNYAGAGKVHFELQKEYQDAGYEVDKVDLHDLFPNGKNLYQKFFGIPFTKRLFEYLKKNSYKYDVIDANLTNITYPKPSFGFKGLLIARSQGILPLYERSYQIDRFVQVTQEINKKSSFKSKIGSFIRSFHKGFTIEDFNLSAKYADIIHCLNQAEYDYFLEAGFAQSKLVLLPNGLSKSYLQKLECTAVERYTNKKDVSIIGAWHIVKGSKDWNDIASKLIKDQEFNSIMILGTVMPEDYVKKDFEANIFPFLNIIPRYDPDKLPELLKNVKVAVSSSYMEGLPYAVLEQLAAGIPVVGYDVPGVHDFLSQVDYSLLVPAGKVEELAQKISQILNLTNDEYNILSKKCIEVSKRYILENVSPLFLNLYKTGLEKISHN